MEQTAVLVLAGDEVTMPQFEGQYLSIVLLGRQNPQILNHDFLLQHGVLPVDREPFRSILQQTKQRPGPDEFISVPVMTTIRYGLLSIVVEENRYQIIDRAFGMPSSSPIAEITKSYFGRLLRYTPFAAGGVNFSGIIHFTDEADERAFDKRLGIDAQIVQRVTGTDATRVGAVLSFPWRNGVVEVQLPKPKDKPLLALINFNYEFGYTDIDAFLANLDDIDAVYERFLEFLGSMEVKVRA